MHFESDAVGCRLILYQRLAVAIYGDPLLTTVLRTTLDYMLCNELNTGNTINYDMSITA